MKKVVLGAIIAALFAGCASDSVDLNNYPSTLYNPVNIPDVCKKEYKNLLNPPRVAIMKFSNNSNFGVAKVTNVAKSYKGGVALGISSFGAGANAHENKNKNIVNRVVEPKLDKAIASAFEGVLASMGGVNLYSRDDLQKIIKEQKLQQSGLFNQDTLVKLGELAGVNYIITGSIDSVQEDSSDYTGIAKVASMILLQSNADSKEKVAGIAGANLAAKALSGTKITTTITFKVLDVTSGKILFSKQITESTKLSSSKPTYSEIIGAIKYDIMNGLKAVKPAFSAFFAPKGYILQVKSDKKHKNFIAQINLGSRDGIKAGQTFKIYQLSAFVDPITHKRSCDTSYMDAKLIVSKNQIQTHRAWTLVEGDDAKKVRPGDIVKRDKLKN